MSKTRESNFDLLRIISAFAVIMLHISYWFLRIDDTSVFTNCHFPTLFMTSITRFAVPCFFMLSGAFILADERNADHKYFYKKSFKNIGITGAIFCLLYVLYNIVKIMASTFILHRRGADDMLHGIFSIIKSLIAGRPYGHLWYLFTLAGLYLAAPFVIHLAADLRGGGGKPIRQNNDSISCSCKRKLHNE